MIIDVETAFLHGNFPSGEEIYMECPPGMLDAKGDEVLLLLKTIYGLVQAARAFYKNFSKTLRELGFEGGYADPCLLTRKGKFGTVHIALYVLMIVTAVEMLKKLRSLLRKGMEEGFH